MKTEEKFKNIGIVIVPNAPLRTSEERYLVGVYRQWKRKANMIKDQFGLEVEESDPLVEIRAFDADHRENDTSLSDHCLEWLAQTEGTDKYDVMTNYLPASLLKRYKQGDVMKLHHVPSNKDMEFKCLVKYISIATTWEETLEKLNV